jgi:hypothetical protein
LVLSVPDIGASSLDRVVAQVAFVMTDALIIQDNFAHALHSRGPYPTRVLKNMSL